MPYPARSARLSLACLSICGLVAINCSVNETGLGAGSASGGPTGGRGTGGGPIAASGGRTGSGGIAAPPLGTGGTPSATGGAGTGGTVGGGSGGIVATGGASAAGGQNVGTGGATPGTGGDPGASGGVIGSGTGGIGTTPPGTGGTMVPGTGGATGACSPTTCPNGCCSTEGRCVTGTANARCGRGGGLCVDCGSCLSCEAGTCTLIPTSRWDVICVSASVAHTKPNGTPWDSSATGLPDPICRSVTPNGAADVSTDAEMDTLSPMWDAPITPTAILGGGRVTASALMSGPNGLPRWGISVVDNDSNGAANDVVCAVAPRLVATDFATGVISLPAVGSCLNLTIRLECAE